MMSCRGWKSFGAWRGSPDSLVVESTGWKLDARSFLFILERGKTTARQD